MQSLVANYPELIGDADGTLLLIRREQPIADAVDASGRWSLDHLFVTRTAVPVLVELKRAVDTRLRREVVGQMLDYAANSVAYWQAGTIASAFAATCEAANVDPETTLSAFLEDADSTNFWDQVDANFRAGQVKLVFVADVIPGELARIVEFLNEQMRADVRAVELNWYESEVGITTLVPRIIGDTARAAAEKSARPSLPSISTDDLIETQIRRYGDEAVRGAYAYVALVRELGGRAEVSDRNASILGVFDTKTGRAMYALRLVAATGRIEINFRRLKVRPGLVDNSARQAIYDAFVSVVGPLSHTNLSGAPSFSVSILGDASRREGIAAATRHLIDVAITEPR